MIRCILISCFLLLAASATWAHPPQAPASEPVEFDPIQIKGRSTDLIGLSESASAGFVGQEEFKYRPLFRNGELLEVIPGMVATQHSGSGKANQFFLRGFNLDHGTDFSTSVDGVPMNLRTHGHGQGYLDLNSIIPELVDNVEYGKGPYYTQIGDFSSAGFSEINTVHSLDQGIAKVNIGTNDFYRVLGANSSRIGDGDLLYAAELTFYRGPWTNTEDLQKYKGMLKYSGGDYDNGFSVIANTYYGSWNSTDQIPSRAVDTGRLSRLDAVDSTDGGNTQRYTLSGSWWNNTDTSNTEISGYAYYYDLNLWSNFTYFLEDEVLGDQFEQVDQRLVVGTNASHAMSGDWGGFDYTNTLGLQFRYDYIPEVGLFRTHKRQRTDTVNQARVNETSLSIYGQNEIVWNDYVRTVLGLRGDFYWMDVTDRNIAVNSGSTFDAIASPKFSLILGPWADTEFFVNAGSGFHSNDARGATLQIDPVTGDPVSPVSPLVRAMGAEVGMRTQFIPKYTSTLAFWYLKLDSELVFVGDAGTTEPSGKSQRYGVEWANFYRPFDWLTLDADLAFSHAEFLNTAPGEWRVPNSVGQVITLGATGQWPFGLFGSIRMRYFNDIPLTEDGSANAPSTMIWNMKLGYRYQNFTASMDIFNMFDSKDNDITYFYRSRLPGERTEGFDDIHFHPVEPRQFRFTLAYAFD